MQTIKTKYLQATNSRGSRVKAMTTNGDSITRSWRYELGDNENHIETAKELLKKLDWKGTWTGGQTKVGMVFVNFKDTTIIIL